jgi:hypothetical protein
MRTTTIVLAAAFAFTGPVAFAQGSSGSSSGGGSTGASSGGASSTGAGRAAGTALSNGTTINGTGGSPGPNNSNALNHGTTGNNLGGGGTKPNTSSPSAAVDTPAANRAVDTLSNPDTGILKK